MISNLNLVDYGLKFLVDSKDPNCYTPGNSYVTDVIGKLQGNMTNVVHQNNTFVFNNSSNSNVATSYISFNTSDFYVRSNGFTVNCLFKYSNGLQPQVPSWWRQTAFSSGVDALSGNFCIERYRADNQMTFRYKFEEGATYGNEFTFSPSAGIDNVWHFVTASVELGYINLYYNGVLQTRVSIMSYTDPTNNQTSLLRLGAQNDLYGFIGNISHASYYDRGLSFEEVKRNYEFIKSRHQI